MMSRHKEINQNHLHIKYGNLICDLKTFAHNFSLSDTYIDIFEPSAYGRIALGGHSCEYVLEFLHNAFQEFHIQLKNKQSYIDILTQVTPNIEAIFHKVLHLYKKAKQARTDKKHQIISTLRHDKFEEIYLSMSFSITERTNIFTANWHNIGLVITKERIYLLNRGLGKITGGIFIYKRSKALEAQLYQLVESHKAMDQKVFKTFEHFLETKAELITMIPHKSQALPTCTFSTNKLLFKAILIEELGKHTQKVDRLKLLDITNQLYKIWTGFLRHYALNYFCNKYFPAEYQAFHREYAFEILFSAFLMIQSKDISCPKNHKFIELSWSISQVIQQNYDLLRGLILKCDYSNLNPSVMSKIYYWLEQAVYTGSIDEGLKVIEKIMQINRTSCFNWTLALQIEITLSTNVMIERLNNYLQHDHGKKHLMHILLQTNSNNICPNNKEENHFLLSNPKVFNDKYRNKNLFIMILQVIEPQTVFEICNYIVEQQFFFYAAQELIKILTQEIKDAYLEPENKKQQLYIEAYIYTQERLIINCSTTTPSGIYTLNILDKCYELGLENKLIDKMHSTLILYLLDYCSKYNLHDNFNRLISYLKNNPSRIEKDDIVPQSVQFRQEEIRPDILPTFTNMHESGYHTNRILNSERKKEAQGEKFNTML